MNVLYDDNSYNKYVIQHYYACFYVLFRSKVFIFAVCFSFSLLFSLSLSLSLHPLLLCIRWILKRHVPRNDNPDNHPKQAKRASKNLNH